MLGPSHRTAGIATATALVAFLPFAGIPEAVLEVVFLPSHYGVATCGLFITFSIIGSLLPDADMPGSTYGKRFRILLIPMYAIRAMIRGLGKFFKPFRKLAKAIGHRGLFHAPIFWTLIYVILRLVCLPLGIFANCCITGLYLGVLSHIFLDFISGGIPLLAPFSMKKYKAPVCIRTGSRKEIIFSIVNVALIFVFVIYIALHLEYGGLSLI